MGHWWNRDIREFYSLEFYSLEFSIPAFLKFHSRSIIKNRLEHVHMCTYAHMHTHFWINHLIFQKIVFALNPYYLTDTISITKQKVMFNKTLTFTSVEPDWGNATQHYSPNFPVPNKSWHTDCHPVYKFMPRCQSTPKHMDSKQTYTTEG